MNEYSNSTTVEWKPRQRRTDWNVMLSTKSIEYIINLDSKRGRWRAETRGQYRCALLRYT